MNDILLNHIASLILGPTPIWHDLPDVSGLFAANAPAVEERVSSPVVMPSVEALLATPDGFRLPGHDAVLITRTNSSAGY